MTYIDDAFSNLRHNLEITQTEQDTEMVQIIDHGAQGYAVKFDGVDALGPFPACPQQQANVPARVLGQ